MIQERFFLS